MARQMDTPSTFHQVRPNGTAVAFPLPRTPTKKVAPVPRAGQDEAVHSGMPRSSVMRELSFADSDASRSSQIRAGNWRAFLAAFLVVVALAAAARAAW